MVVGIARGEAPNSFEARNGAEALTPEPEFLAAPALSGQRVVSGWNIDLRRAARSDVRVIRVSPDRISAESLIPASPAVRYKYTHKEVVDNIAFSDQGPFSSESGSWLFSVLISWNSSANFSVQDNREALA